MKKGRGRIIFLWTITLLCAIAVIGALSFKFSIEIRKDTTDAMEREMEKIAEKYALRIMNDLQSITTSGEMIAQVIGQQEDAAVVQQLLMSIVNQTQIYAAFYCGEDGMAMDQDGETYNLETTGHAESMEQLLEIEYDYMSDDGISGKEAVSIRIPIPEGEGNLFLLYPMDRMKSLMEMGREFNQEAFAVMADRRGNVYSYEEIGSNFVKNGNIWKNIDRQYINACTQLRVDMQNLSVGSISLAAGGEKRMLVYAPMGVGDWCLVIGISQSYVDNRQGQELTKMLFMMIQLLCAVALFFIFFAIRNAISKKRSAENSKTLEEKADTDLLTGLTNKLATERKIKEYIRDYPNSLAMMFVLDIDDFKKINDTLGHAFGDEVLRTLGKHIGVNFRVTDIIGRTGGDEFTIFLKDLKEDANVLKEGQKLEKFFKDFQAGDYVKYSPTASIGAAVFPTDAQDFDSLYKKADEALYKAKRRGKNQLAYFDDRDRKE